MEISGYFILFIGAYGVVADTDGAKWVWRASRRSDRGQRVTYTGVASSNSYAAALVPPSESLFKPSSDLDGTLSPQATKLRYQVTEPNDFPTPPRPSNRPSIYPEEQYRPTTTTVNGFRPDSYRPDQDNFRPGNRPNQNGNYNPNQNGYRPPGNGYRPTGGSDFNRPSFGSSGSSNFNRPSSGSSGSSDFNRPSFGSGGSSDFNRPSLGSYKPTTGPNGRPILTGPVPSWEQGDNNRYKNYDRCKCVHSFNCNTPGIKFGSCDVDKQYCCYNDLNGNRPNGNFQGGVNNEQRPILAGPGGPVDRPGQYRPYQEEEFSRPTRPGSNYNRYPDRFRDSSEERLEEAYKKGLESAIYETIQKPSRFQSGRQDYGGYEDYYGQDSFNKRPRPNHKYGLYQPSGSDNYGGRSANLNSTIEALPEKRKN